ncbi:flagellar motor switch protein [Roseivivax sp. GX 12232]|uniref:flagellar motor switch protein n=1 Tax=Roseivivax sp. GX 12232 TaxID=2900547 RepID=UPI001E50FA70|nr:flagellar motor switch protein [Roseivivax sp. GX 12232]MCE0503872.1 flagellar motor switch protein [Roseivivax sp. GX 12232]
MIGQFIDIAIGVLLVVAIGFGVVLDRRVRRLTRVLAELRPAIDDYSIAVDRSEDTVVKLRSAAGPHPSLGRERDRAEPRVEKPASSSPFTFRSRRSEPEPAPAGANGVAQIDGKSALVRSFFETARSREA